MLLGPGSLEGVDVVALDDDLVIEADNADVLAQLPGGAFDLVSIDPPFNTASSRPGGWCLDFFAGSGTLGAVCAALGRRYVLIDCNPEAVAVMERRLGTSAASRASAAG